MRNVALVSEDSSRTVAWHTVLDSSLPREPDLFGLTWSVLCNRNRNRNRQE